ncbi:gustatory receptor for bitter taste 66a-like [Venturia canescens]|uniref:gustatory receptor for bitter taste 66a-like n=1 Tax=Venturia canescens TaxID=32260 RepID=UPI001C9BF157|nr:gustatory receptor for bitter taste 66a-like [Venturia canescens]
MDITILVTLVAWLGMEYRSINNKIKDVVARANTSLPKIIVTSDFYAENLRILSKFHYDLCEIGKRLNRRYYAPVIVNVTTAFVILSTNLFFLLDELRHGDYMSMMVFVSYIQLEISYSLPIIITVIICNWTSNQAAHTAELIHEIRAMNTDSQLYDVIKSFSLQLHHQKLEFTACGLFPLDSSLLQMMVGKITTYLVILIQFQSNLGWSFESS